MAKRNQRSKITDRSPEENEAISDKVDDLLVEGYPIDQATAIAFRMFRDNELTIKAETTPEYRIQHPKKKSLLQQIAEAAAILKLGERLLSKDK